MSDQFVLRLGRVLLLLRSRDLYDPGLPTSTGQMIRTNTKAESREGNPETILCRDCGGKGRKRVRTIWQTCVTCRGSGCEVVDQYTRRRLGTETQAAEQRQRMVCCDRCGGTGKGRVVSDGRADRRLVCEVCWGAKVVPGPETVVRPFEAERDEPLVRELVRGLRDPILRSIVVKGAMGSYHELSHGLAELRLESVRAYDATVAQEQTLTPLRSLRYDLPAWFGLMFLERRMPAEIRVPPDVIAIAKREAFERRKRERRQQEAA